jgi:hypothetical protein
MGGRGSRQMRLNGALQAVCRAYRSCCELRQQMAGMFTPTLHGVVASWRGAKIASSTMTLCFLRLVRLLDAPVVEIRLAAYLIKHCSFARRSKHSLSSGLALRRL